MANITKTIEDFSPLIVYSGNGGGDWVPGTSASDSSLDQYSQASYMVTTTDRASLSFSFYGNSLRIFGSKRSNHGQYQVNIDSLVYPPANGQVNDTRGQFQTSLFSTAALALGYHTVRMTNLGTSPLDVDFITWQTPIGSPGDGSISNAIVDDSDTSIKYTPPDRWDYKPDNLGAVVGASVHATTTAGASVEYEFEMVSGNAIGIYGPVGPNFAAYSVQVDSGTATNFSATKGSYRPQTMLFFTSNLANGAHTVKIQHESWNNSALSLAVDYFEVFSSKPIRASGSASSKALEPGPVAGIAIGSFVLALIISSIAFFFFHRRSKRKPSTISSQNSGSEKGIDTINPYRPISNGNTLLLPPGGTDTTSPPLTAAPPPALTPLRSQVSDGSFNNTPPMTGSLWPATPPTAGQGGSPAASPSADRTSFNPNVQVITVPYTADGKYRPDLANPAPQLLPVPPPSARRNQPQTAGPPSPIAEGSSSSSIYTTTAATAGVTTSSVVDTPGYSEDPPTQTNGPVITITAEQAEALNLIPAGTIVGDAGTVVTALHGLPGPNGPDSVTTAYGSESAPPTYVQDGPSVSRVDEKR